MSRSLRIRTSFADIGRRANEHPRMSRGRRRHPVTTTKKIRAVQAKDPPATADIPFFEVGHSLRGGHLFVEFIL